MPQFMTDPSRYIKHPAPGSDQWQDGDPWDTGTAMIVSNNYQHLAAESHRHLIWDVAQGSFSSDIGQTVDGREATEDEPATTGSPSGVGEIVWSPTNAIPYQPILLITDARGAGLYVPRKLRFAISLTRGGVGSAKLYVALTPYGVQPRVDGTVLASYSTTVSGSGVVYDYLTSNALAAGTEQLWTGRGSSERGELLTGVFAATFWLGVMVAEAATLDFNSVSVYEVPS